MPLPINGAVGVATLAAGSREAGVFQAVAQFPVGRQGLVGTFWLASSGTTMLIGSGVASADHLLLTLDPGAGIRWTITATAAGASWFANASTGHPLMAVGSYPEALEVVGSAAISQLRIALLGGEPSVAKVNLEFSRFVL